MIECTTLHGEKKLVKEESLFMRPASYGLVFHKKELLVVNTKSTGKWSLPGGAIEKGEKAEIALTREIKEETGIDITIESLFSFEESFFYYDPWDTAFQNFSFIYLCTPQSFHLTDSQNEKRDEAEKPQWVDVQELEARNFQEFVRPVFRKYKETNFT